ncbi:MAG: hypothetical protein FIA92_07625 [Chloroflexi bacterium]|nr:hypothetical protein [Chloroflexota bacterium]
MILGPAPVLAAIVGLFHVSLYVFLRGRAGARLPFLLLAAFLGAWAGDTVGSRLGDPLTIGDFHVAAASFVAWLGIGLVAILAILAPERPREPRIRLSIGRRVLAGLGRAESPDTTPEPGPQPEPEARS